MNWILCYYKLTKLWTYIFAMHVRIGLCKCIFRTWNIKMCKISQIISNSLNFIIWSKIDNMEADKVKKTEFDLEKYHKELIAQRKKISTDFFSSKTICHW